jgi:hypothetical protein
VKYNTFVTFYAWLSFPFIPFLAFHIIFLLQKIEQENIAFANQDWPILPIGTLVPIKIASCFSCTDRSNG